MDTLLSGTLGILLFLVALFFMHAFIITAVEKAFIRYHRTTVSALDAQNCFFLSELGNGSITYIELPGYEGMSMAKAQRLAQKLNRLLSNEPIVEVAT